MANDISILFIDNTPSTMKGTIEYIELELGYKTHICKNINDGGKLLTQNNCNVLIIEPMFQEELAKSSIESVKEFMKSAKQKGILTIISSAHFEERLHRKYNLNTGQEYDLYFKKPYDAKNLVSSLKEKIN